MSMMDMEFEKLRGLLPNIALDTMAVKEHVEKLNGKLG